MQRYATRQLFDVKTVHGGGPDYMSARARGEDGQSGAVAQRAARVHRDEFWQAMRAYYFQFQADRNQSLHDKDLPRIKLKDLIPVVARQIFSQDELNNLDAL